MPAPSRSRTRGVTPARAGASAAPPAGLAGSPAGLAGSPAGLAGSPAEPFAAIGDRIRAERTRRGLSVRALARAAGLSPSLISQLETGKSRPSVSTLYALTGILAVSIGDLLDEPGAAEPTPVDPRAAGIGPGLAALLAANSLAAQPDPSGPTGRTVTGPDRMRAVGPVSEPGRREVIALDSGVTWELLGQLPGTHVDFLLMTYQPGGRSSSSGELMRHSGEEYGYLISGALTLQLGFSEYRLEPGDSVCFTSATPHGYRNEGDVPAVGVWMVLDQG